MVKLTIKANDFLEKEKITQYSISNSNFNDDLSICDFYELCKKLAVVYGYHINNIEEYFPEIQ